MTVIVDQKTHKVIWVSHSRRKEALDTFFEILGDEACKKIKVVATDQHEGYNASVKQHRERSKKEREHLQEVMGLNRRMMVLELIKERIHRMFNCGSVKKAKEHFGICYQWADKLDFREAFFSFL